MKVWVLLMNIICRCGRWVFGLLLSLLVLCSVGCSVLLKVCVSLDNGLLVLELGCFIYRLLKCGVLVSIFSIGVMWLVGFSCGSLVSIISFWCVKISLC